MHVQGQGLVAGVDEAGRGPLAGPVVAAAVILDDVRPIAGLADSKVLSPARRDRLHDEIRARALCCSVGLASVQEIDALNILHATLLAMQRAVAGLRLVPHHVLVDGNRLPALPMPAQAIVKGDARVKAISAASIVAKVHRDRLCAELHAQWPAYGFDGHKGYPTPEHLEALQRLGPCPEHRRSYAPVRAALQAALTVSLQAPLAGEAGGRVVAGDVAPGPQASRSPVGPSPGAAACPRPAPGSHAPPSDAGLRGGRRARRHEHQIAIPWDDMP